MAVGDHDTLLVRHTLVQLLVFGIMCRPSTQQVSPAFKTYLKERIKSLSKELLQGLSLHQAYHGQKLN